MAQRATATWTDLFEPRDGVPTGEDVEVARFVTEPAPLPSYIQSVLDRLGGNGKVIFFLFSRKGAEKKTQRKLPDPESVGYVEVIAG